MELDIVVRVLRGVGDLPTLPQSTQHVIELSRNPDTTTHSLEAAVAADPAFAARILRFANSSFFGLRSRVSTIGRAIVLMGYKRIEALAVAANAYSMCEMAGEKNAAWATQLWEHLIASAIACKTLAHAFHAGNEEECFTAALMHDLGKALIMSRLPQVPRRLAGKTATRDRSIVEHEARLVGFSHEDVLRCLLATWDFPKLLVDAAGYHHHPLDAPEHRLQAYLVCAASALATRNGFAVRHWAEESIPDDLSPSLPRLDASVIKLTEEAIEQAHEELVELK